VADDGPGIPPGELARIFTPFFTTKPAGTGLGLAVVQRIADAHGGSVSVESAPGEGARFTVRLPVAAPDAGAVPG
jgi:two-component system sensor histidine kinase HydH